MRPDPALNEPVVRFTDTATGQRQTMEDAHGLTSYIYDNRDRLLVKQTVLFINCERGQNTKRGRFT